MCIGTSESLPYLLGFPQTSQCASPPFQERWTPASPPLEESWLWGRARRLALGAKGKAAGKGLCAFFVSKKEKGRLKQ